MKMTAAESAMESGGPMEFSSDPTGKTADYIFLPAQYGRHKASKMDDDFGQRPKCPLRHASG
jgi:hypothetical protein